MNAPPTDNSSIDRYVDAALELHGYHLSGESHAAVQQAFKVIAGLASIVMSQPLEHEDEMAPVFRAGVDAP